MEDAGLSILLVRGTLMAVRVERLTRRDVEDAMAGEAEDGLLIGERGSTLGPLPGLTVACAS